MKDKSEKTLTRMSSLWARFPAAIETLPPPWSPHGPLLELSAGCLSAGCLSAGCLSAGCLAGVAVDRRLVDDKKHSKLPMHVPSRRIFFLQTH